jgi:hypothetical protein
MLLCGAAWGIGTNILNDWDFLVGARTSPSDFTWPYLLLPFVAGAWVSRHALLAAISGVLTVVTAFFGYYMLLLHRIVQPLWILLFPANNPWVLLEVLAGVAFGLLGWKWRRGSPRIATICALLPALEAAFFALHGTALVRAIPGSRIQPPDYPRNWWNLALWAGEVLLSLLLIRLAQRQAQRAHAEGRARSNATEARQPDELGARLS